MGVDAVVEEAVPEQVADRLVPGAGDAPVVGERRAVDELELVARVLGEAADGGDVRRKPLGKDLVPARRQELRIVAGQDDIVAEGATCAASRFMAAAL
jgi:hypothetical protein